MGLSLYNFIILGASLEPRGPKIIWGHPPRVILQARAEKRPRNRKVLYRSAEFSGGGPTSEPVTPPILYNYIGGTPRKISREEAALRCLAPR
jgi:hypothetical protein